jgi:hypothetical protein
MEAIKRTLKRYRGAWLSLNVIFYGALVTFMIVGALMPALQDQVRGSF